MSGYDVKARVFLRVHGFSITSENLGFEAPPWNENGIHGEKYRVKIRRTTGSRQSITFPFWNSQAAMENGEELTDYDVLACLSSEANMPTDPDQVVEELGEMKPSQAIASANFAKRLQAFFTERELEALSRIQ